MTSMYERVGGEATLRKVCETFHGLVMRDPLLGPLFAYSGHSHVEHLTMFLAEMFGGPARFSAERGGITGLYDAHLELGITEEQRARFVELFVRAGQEGGLPDDPAFRAAFERHITAGSRFSMKFSQPGLPAEPPPFPAVEPWSWDQG